MTKVTPIGTAHLKRTSVVDHAGRLYARLAHEFTGRVPVIDIRTRLPRLNRRGQAVTREAERTRLQLVSLRRTLQKAVMEEQGLATGRQWRRWLRANRAVFDEMLGELAKGMTT